MWRGWSPPDGFQLPKFSANDGHPHDDDATATLACFPPSSSCSGYGGGGCGHNLLGPKLLLVMGCVKLGEKNCVQQPSVAEQNAN